MVYANIAMLTDIHNTSVHITTTTIKETPKRFFLTPEWFFRIAFSDGSKKILQKYKYGGVFSHKRIINESNQML